MAKMINIGFGNIISVDRLVAVLDPESAPIKRLISDARDKGLLIDATYGRKKRSVLICDSHQVILTSVQPDTISHRINEINHEEIRK